jgi:CRISPR-associated protein Cmr5
MALTIQQQRAQFALNYVQRLSKSLNADEKKEFISYASGLPAMIHMNGLGQAMAFCKSKVKANAYQTLYQLVSDWLCDLGQPYHGKNNVLNGITSCDRAQYQLAQAEALVLMSWVKKFAKAFLAEDQS